MRGEEGGDVSDDTRGRAGEAAVGGRGDGAPPAALVEAVDGDGVRGEVAEEGVVAVDVVGIAVNEDYFGLDRGVGVGLQGGLVEDDCEGGVVLIVRGSDGACDRTWTTYEP